MNPMNHRPRALITLLVVLAACGAPPGSKVPEVIWPQDGSLIVEADLALSAGPHLRPPVGAEGHGGVILIEGRRGLTLDLGQAHLLGAGPGVDPDERSGWGIVLRDCRDVVVRGGVLGGYKGCIVLENCQDVTIEGVRFEGWYAQRLYSTLAAADTGDHLYPHNNEQGQWLSNHGAAISALNCTGLTIRGNSGRGGQNGILLSNVTTSEVYDNDFSFMSGWGLAMYRSTANTISHNAFDYCVRGFSHGVYSRGQDSAGILMFERCSDNVIAYNSATHGGDGVFLFAGRDLVEGLARERGEPEPTGSDNNLFYGNDLRFSPANGLEATFSDRNLVIENDLSGCYQHGVWAGYSSNTLILRNTIDDTVGGGVTIEHGQDNVIAENTFRRNNMAVELFWDPDPHLVDGVLGEQRDTSSRDSWVISNIFEGNTQDIVLRDTTGVAFFDNDWIGPGRRPYIDGLGAAGGREVADETLRGWLADRDGELPSGNFSDSSLREWVGRYPALLDEFGRMEPPDVPGTRVVRAEDRGLEIGDRSTIIMGEWGPWDYRSGDPKPAPRLPGGLLRDSRWQARWFKWSLEEGDPRKDLEGWRELGADPLVTKEVPNFMAPWSDEEVRAAVGNDYFGLVATTEVEVPGGTYELSVLSDDGVRVLIDGREVFADWTWHAPRRGRASVDLEPGWHEFTLEYFQIDGDSALTVELEPDK
jgi:parallel beta-helix repeat protein